MAELVLVPGKRIIEGPAQIEKANFKGVCTQLPGVMLRPPDGICYWESNKIPINLIRPGISSIPDYPALAQFDLDSVERWTRNKSPCPLCGGGCTKCNKHVATDGIFWWDVVLNYVVYDMTEYPRDITTGDLEIMRAVWPVAEV